MHSAHQILLMRETVMVVDMHGSGTKESTSDDSQKMGFDDWQVENEEIDGMTEREKELAYADYQEGL